MPTKFHPKNPKVRDNSEDITVNEKITLKFILKKRDVNWIDVAQDRGQLRTFANTIMNLWVS
jgi:hypothetical protein